MYYQVRVPEYQQSFIKFLWWENQNIEQEPSDFAMCAATGGVLSATCLNYTLKKTATDNTDWYGKEAAEVVRSTCYLDYLLKSVEDPKTAMILVKNAVDKCKSWGFLGVKDEKFQYFVGSLKNPTFRGRVHEKPR